MRARVRRPLLALATFAGMEGVAYAAHRWIMHGPGIVWHESHHRTRTGVLERNDLYPATFAALTIGAMAAGTAMPRVRGAALSVGAGVTAYGAAYLLVHDGVIHQRLGRRVTAVSRRPAGSWLRHAHGQHHADAGEPYGMLLPVTARRRAPQPPGSKAPPPT